MQMEMNGKKKISGVALAAAAAVFGLLALFALIPLVISASRPGPACLLCHEMREPYQMWRLSTHREVSCGKCHYAAPSGFGMLRAAFSRSAKSEEKKTVSKGCRTCHENISNVVKIEKLKFPHDNHQNVNDCETCHLGVTHGAGIEYSHPESRKMCYDCHKPHTINPHSGKWLNVHRKKGRESTRDCQACHTFNSCTQCHKIIERHKSDWYDGHREMARKSEYVCAKCHDRKFCASCHDGFTLHEKGWLKKHKGDDRATKTKENCVACHTEKYCADCHDGKAKLHHEGNWLSHHGKKISDSENGSGRDIEPCVECHEPSFCLSCHKGLSSKIHSENYEKMHRSVTSASMPTCLKCHTLDTCNQCHSNKLPATHVDRDKWKKEHGLNSIHNMSSCNMCHNPEFCEACHKRKVPGSHESKGWGTNHKAGSQGKDRNCGLCHEDKYCNTCHRRTRPPDHYMKTWRKTHGRTAVFDMSGCFVCHVNSDCRLCHEEGKTHKAAGWMLEHKSSKQNFSSCDQCHTLKSCAECHSEMKLTGHAVCANCHKSLDKPKDVDTDVCANCHTAVTNKPGHAAHDGLNCKTCHKPHVWPAAADACMKCHGDIDEDHTMELTCRECHAFK